MQQSPRYDSAIVTNDYFKGTGFYNFPAFTSKVYQLSNRYSTLVFNLFASYAILLLLFQVNTVHSCSNSFSHGNAPHNCFF